MSEGDKGKLVGGAAVGAGGILVAVLKSGSAEMHVAETGMQAAARAGELGAVARGAGELGAGAAAGAGGRGLGSALRTAEHGAERLVLAGAAGEVEIRSLRPVVLGSVADDGTLAAKTLAPAGTKTASKTTTSAATRTSKVKEVLAHAEDVDPKELFDRLKDVWDLSQALDDDEDEEVDKKFQSLGVDFRGDVVPSVAGKPLAALPGATRTLLSDGHKLVPAARLPDALPSTALTEQEKQEVALGGRPEWAVYVQHPLPPALAKTSPQMLLLMATYSPEIAWRAIDREGTGGSLPQVLEQGTRRFVRVTVPASDAGAPRVILLRATP